MFNAFNVWYILAKYKRKVEVQIELHVKYFNSKCVMAYKFVYFYNILNFHGLMIVGEQYQEYIGWSIYIAMRIQNLCEVLNILSKSLKKIVQLFDEMIDKDVMSLEMMLNTLKTLVVMWYKPKSNWLPMMETQPTLE